MASRTLPSAIAAAALLVAACGEERVSVYKIPKERDPEPPQAGADGRGAGQQAPGSPMAGTSVPTAAGSALAWVAPAAWKPREAGAVRKGSYSVPSGGAEADLSITAFPGDVGGELANVNRWRGQVGLPPLRPEELEASVSRMEANGLNFTVVELFPAGDPAARSLLGAIVPHGGSTWFFKLTGPGAALRESRPAFMDFLRTVRPPDR